MSQLGSLLELIHEAHSRCRTFEAEYRDWNKPRPSFELHVERSELGETHAHWRGGGPFPVAVANTRRIWMNAAGGLRVEVVRGHELARLGVLSVNRWWLWDRELGAVFGDLPPGAPGRWTPPPLLLTPPLVNPASLVALFRFEIVGSGVRAGRKVISTCAVRRPPSAVARSLRYEFDFDNEHGTLLRRAALDGGQAVSVTEALAVQYDGPVADGLFVFRSPDGQPVRDVRSDAATSTTTCEPESALQQLTATRPGGPAAATERV